MTAIDISTYQGHPDFAAVKAAGVQLVIMREGGADGGLYLDKVYLANRAAARAQGLPIGSYFFNGPAIAPAACADWMLANGDYRPGDLMILDVEGAGLAWSPAQVLVWVQRMLARGVRIADIGVYMSASPERSQDWSAVAATGAFLWVASYGTNNGSPGTPPKPTHWAAWSLWQYTSTATCPGVAGRVDTSMIAAGFPASTHPQEDEDMKALIWHATSASTAAAPMKIAAGDFWAIGSPQDAAYVKVDKYKAQDMVLMGANQQDNSGDNIAAYVSVYKPLPSQAGSSASALPDPAAWGKLAGDAAAAEITSALESLGFTVTGGFAPKKA